LWNHKVDKWELFIYLFIYIIWGSFFWIDPTHKLLGSTSKSSPVPKGHNRVFTCSLADLNWGPWWHQTRVASLTHHPLRGKRWEFWGIWWACDNLESWCPIAIIHHKVHYKNDGKHSTNIFQHENPWHGNNFHCGILKLNKTITLHHSIIIGLTKPKWIIICLR
jgi:hypothetical protein